MSLIHTPDEPIDIVREIGIMFNETERRQLTTELRDTYYGKVSLTALELDAFIQRMYEDADESTLHLSDSVDLIKGIIGADAFQVLSQQIETWAGHGRNDWPGGVSRYWTSVRDLVRTKWPDVPDWDLLVLGCNLIQHDEVGAVCTIDDDGVRQWEGGLGRLL